MKTQEELVKEMENRNEASAIYRALPMVDYALIEVHRVADALGVLEKDVDGRNAQHPVNSALVHIAKAQSLLRDHADKLVGIVRSTGEENKQSGVETITINPYREWHCPKCGSIIIAAHTYKNDEMVCSCGEKIDPFYSVPCNNRGCR
jgi:hypothetical protein